MRHFGLFSTHTPLAIKIIQVLSHISFMYVISKRIGKLAPVESPELPAF